MIFGNSKIFTGVDFLEHVSVDGIPSVDRFTLVGDLYHHWMVLFKICVRGFGPSTKMAPHSRTFLLEIHIKIFSETNCN
jgi:hypothetical protein